MSDGKGAAPPVTVGHAATWTSDGIDDAELKLVERRVAESPIKICDNGSSLFIGQTMGGFLSVRPTDDQMTPYCCVLNTTAENTLAVAPCAAWMCAPTRDLAVQFNEWIKDDGLDKTIWLGKFSAEGCVHLYLFDTNLPGGEEPRERREGVLSWL